MPVTTPKLLEALCERISLKKAAHGVFCGGTEMTPQFHRFAVEELMEGAHFAPTYGNTLMGLAASKPPSKADNWAVIYYPPAPRAMIEVVDPDDTSKVVEYGKTGRTRLTTMTKEFYAAVSRRDNASVSRGEQYPWAGVRSAAVLARPEDGGRAFIRQTQKGCPRIPKALRVKTCCTYGHALGFPTERPRSSRSTSARASRLR